MILNMSNISKSKLHLILLDITILLNITQLKKEFLKHITLIKYKFLIN